MAAFLEGIGGGSFVLRVGPHTFKYRDPYTASGTVVTVSPGVAEVKGFTRRSDDTLSPMEILRDTKACLKAAGFTAFRWERLSGEGSRLIIVRI